MKCRFCPFIEEMEMGWIANYDFECGNVKY